MTSDQNPHSIESLKRIDALCDHFEAAWKNESPPKIEDILSLVPETERNTLFQSLLEIQLEFQDRSILDSVERDLLQRFSDKAIIITRLIANAKTRQAEENPQSKAEPPHTQSFEQTRKHPETIQRFEIESVLGEGGFGTVYKAFDPRLKRAVALKVPLPATLKTEEHLNRFVREAQIAAVLHHPAICPIYEVEYDSNLPFIVMKYVEGSTMADIFKRMNDNNRLMNIAKSIRLIILVGTAVEYAHQKGIIHRDLKPSNIIWDKEHLTPVITDFGLARFWNSKDSDLTATGQIMGTPAYIAPEQARGNKHDAGRQVDVYSLGVIFFELLCGQRPFTGNSYDVVIKKSAEAPPAPSKFRPEIDAQLEEICLKVIARTTEERYQTVQEFLDALQKYQAEDDVSVPKNHLKPGPSEEEPEDLKSISQPRLQPKHHESRPGLKHSSAPGKRSSEEILKRKRSRKKIRKSKSRQQTASKPYLKVVSVILGCLILTGLGYHFFFNMPKTIENKTTTKLVENKQSPQAIKPVETVTTPEPKPVKKTTETNEPPPDAPVKAKPVSFPNETAKLEIINNTETFRKFYGAETATFTKQHFDLTNQLNKTPHSDRPKLQKAIEELTWPLDNFTRKRIPRDLLAAAGGGDAEKAPQEIVGLLGDPRLNCWSKVYAALLIDDEKTIIASHDDGTVSFHETSSGRLLEIRKCHESAIQQVAMSPDGKTYATGSFDGSVSLWDRKSGRNIATFKDHTENARETVFSNDGLWFASGSTDGTICVYSMSKLDKPVYTLSPGSYLNCLKFVQNGKYLVSASNDAVARVWEMKTGNFLRNLEGHSGTVGAIATCDRTQRFATIDNKGKVIIWDLMNWSPTATLQTQSGVSPLLDFSHDGKKIIVRVNNFYRNKLSLWNIESGSEEKYWEYDNLLGILDVHFSQDGQHILTCHTTGRLAIKNLADNSLRFAPTGGMGIPKAELSENGSRLAVLHTGLYMNLWDFNTLEFRKIKTSRLHNINLDITHDGKYFVTAGATWHPAVFNIDSGKLTGRGTPSHRNKVHAFAFSHDGTRIATGGSAKYLILWDRDVMKGTRISCNDYDRFRSVDYSPDDKLLALGGKYGFLQIRNSKTGDLVAALNGKPGESYTVRFSPNGKHILQGTGVGTIHVWDVNTQKKVGAFEAHKGSVYSLKFSPDGNTLASSSRDGTIRIWDYNTQKIIRTIQLTPGNHGSIYLAGFDPAGRHLVASCANGLVYILKL